MASVQGMGLLEEEGTMGENVPDLLVFYTSASPVDRVWNGQNSLSLYGIIT